MAMILVWNIGHMDNGWHVSSPGSFSKFGSNSSMDSFGGDIEPEPFLPGALQHILQWQHSPFIPSFQTMQQSPNISEHTIPIF